MVEDLIPEICNPAITGRDCDLPTCQRVHLSECDLPRSAIFEIAVLFRMQEFAGDDRLKSCFTPREQTLLQTVRPILCWICLDPIEVGSNSWFPCCDIFICSSCAQQWPFQNCCPGCGTESTLATTPPEKCEEIVRRNTHILELTHRRKTK
jgi:hypothetical protein